MAKIVRYNGGIMNYYFCSDPTELVVGREYEVVYAKDYGGYFTAYTLRGVNGNFYSGWFDEVNSDPAAETL